MIDVPGKRWQQQENRPGAQRAGNDDEQQCDPDGDKREAESLSQRLA
jgi:hypothetical protein